VTRLFDRALDLPPAARREWLEEACPDDPELIAAVLRLLRAEEDSRGRLERPGAEAVPALVKALEAKGPPRPEIPSHTIVGELGRGGVGTVYRARQKGPGFERDVAVKVLRRGLDTDDILHRFATERRILASLRHPFIAQLYDAGSTGDGRPYLSMELIQGTPITDWCDRQCSSVEDRLRKVLTVAEAVQAAHSRLVVHRDLKPSNILIDDHDRVKLLDFGIAKLLDPGSAGPQTLTGHLLCTPEYAAPEQLRGEPVSVATDVYQLGAVLFRLLTGQSPQPGELGSAAALRDRADRYEAPIPSTTVARSTDLEALAEQRSTTPARLLRTLKGDLDTIVVKALQPDPEQRYDTVVQLADDLRRFLGGRPITARPLSLSYRSRMYLRRHPWVGPLVATATLVALLFAVMVIRYTRQLDRERLRAQREATRAGEVQHFLEGLFRSADIQQNPDPDRGRAITVVEAMDEGVEQLSSTLETSPDLRADLLMTIARTYGSLGLAAKASPLTREAYDLYTSLEGTTAPHARSSLAFRGTLERIEGKLDTARDTLEQALGLALEARPVDTEEVATYRIWLAHVYLDRTELTAAKEQVRTVLAMTEPEAPIELRAEAARTLSDLQLEAGDPKSAEQSARLAIELSEAAFGSEPSQQLAVAHGSLGSALASQRRYDEAEKHLRLSIDWLERVAGSAYGDRLVEVNNLAVMLVTKGDAAAAAELLEETVRLAEKVYGPDGPEVGTHYQNYGVTLARLGRLDEALAAHRRAATILEATRTEIDPTRAFPLLSISGVYLTQGRPAEALTAADEALGILRANFPAGHAATAVASCRRARSLAAIGRTAEARAAFADATSVLVEKGPLAYQRECLRAAATFLRGEDVVGEAVALETALTAIEPAEESIAVGVGGSG